uniref:Secreted protein n=1 Tax=Caenorhabditis japonica TaxID=281687 RepID=A0A8R1EIN1_CAEJA
MFSFKLLLAFFFFLLVANSSSKVVKWHHQVSLDEQPLWRSSQRSRQVCFTVCCVNSQLHFQSYMFQIQGYGPMSAFAESGSSRPLFFGSWRKRFDEE